MPDVAAILKAFGERTRLRILRVLSLQQLAVNELMETLEMTQSRISRHLAILRHAGLVEDRREGNWVYYRMAPDELSPVAKGLWEAVRLQQHDSDFFPEDLERLKQILAMRGTRSRAYFEVVQKEWEKIRQNYIDDPFSLLVASSLVGPEGVAVDVGTGTGELLLPLAQTAGKVIGVDSSEKMLEVCRDRVNQSGLKNVELRLGDAEALPLADEECDTAFSSMLLHHLGDPSLGINEMTRIVKPGGRVVVSDLVKHDCDWTREVMADVWLGFTEEQICQWLSAPGLTDITWSSRAVPWPLEADSSVKFRAFVAGMKRLLRYRPPGSPVKLRAFIASGAKPPR